MFEFGAGDRAAPAVDPTDGNLKEDAHTSRRKISDTAQFAVIPSALYPTTISARRFFERRVSRITQAWGSPNTPITVRAGVESGEAVAIPQAFCLN